MGFNRYRTVIFQILLCLPKLYPFHIGNNFIDTINNINSEFLIEFNVFINLSGNVSEEYEEVLQKTQKVPKLIIIQEQSEVQKDLYKKFNMQILTIVRVEKNNYKRSLNFLDKLLWKRHFTYIIIDWNQEADDLSDNLRLSIFSECWSKGFTKVLLRYSNWTFVYTPFPSLRTIEVKSLRDCTKVWHWQSLEKYNIIVPILQYPPRVFNYRNHKGKVVVTGYFYHIIRTFIEHFNGTVIHDFRDMWVNSTVDKRNRAMENYNFLTVPLVDDTDRPYSDPIAFSYSRLIVPAGKEIDQSLYILLPFEMRLWTVVMMIFLLMIVLIYLAKFRYSQRRDLIGSIFNALKVLIFLSVDDFKRRSGFNFGLNLILLITGFFATNLYSGNLFSMYTSRIYSPDLKTIQDIEKTNLQIFLYSTDYDIFKNSDLPPVFYCRLFYGNNTAFQLNRLRLNMKYIYYGYDDIRNFLLFQQFYLKRPFATELPQHLRKDFLAIILLHRSPFIERFNWYLGYIKTSGLLGKFISDSRWDGVTSGITKFFKDDEINRSLSLLFYQYAFILWAMGMMMATLCFIREIRKDKGKGS